MNQHIHDTMQNWIFFQCKNPVHLEREEREVTNQCQQSYPQYQYSSLLFEDGLSAVFLLAVVRIRFLDDSDDRDV